MISQGPVACTLSRTQAQVARHVVPCSHPIQLQRDDAPSTQPPERKRSTTRRAREPKERHLAASAAEFAKLQARHSCCGAPHHALFISTIFETCEVYHVQSENTHLRQDRDDGRRALDSANAANERLNDSLALARASEASLRVRH